jgi:uncharacterized phage protein gp47/JayE
MPYQRPSLANLIAQAQSDIAAHLPGDDPLLARCVETALARANAGLAHGLHGHAVWLSKQFIPDMADYPWLLRWCSIYGIIPSPAVSANLSLVITGSPGSTCPIGTQWATNDGTLYTQDASVPIVGGVATVTVTANIPAAASNQVNGVAMSLVNPVTGIHSAATVTGTNTEGFDQESQASLLAQLLQRLQKPPKGGGPGDYAAWALAVSGVTRAWEVPLANGAGTVAVYFVCDALANIIPTAPVVATVQAALVAAAPMCCTPTAVAPTGCVLNFALQLAPGGIGADTAAIRAAVVQNLTQYTLTSGAPILVGSNPVSGITLFMSGIEDAIATATGVVNYNLTSPLVNQVYAAGTMPIMGTVTFS